VVFLDTTHRFSAAVLSDDAGDGRKELDSLLFVCGRAEAADAANFHRVDARHVQAVSSGAFAL
jgi:hypothetical protein